MRRIRNILFAALIAFVGCVNLEEPSPIPFDKVPEGERVKISFKVAVPDDRPHTKAMDNTPTIDTAGFYIAVFGGSGYFNEWVKATVEETTVANYDTTAATVYTLSAKFSISDSRLRVHFIANCPTAVRNSPPISGSQDTEEYVMSHIRSQRSDTYNDGYWQKIILPNGVKVQKIGNEYVATSETMAQFDNPIILVRDFARVYLRNLTPNVGTQGQNVHQLVTIKKYGLAYAPSEGVIAPVLSSPYLSNSAGALIDTSGVDKFYFESFFINYQNYSLDQISSEPFNYSGYSPSDQSYNYYTAPGHAEPGVPLESDMVAWDNEHPEKNVLFVYERTLPTSSTHATRIIILAERIDQNGVSDGDRFYALDIVNTEGVAIPLLRNQSYTVHLLNIEAGSGEEDLDDAATATSATVTGDPNYQDLINISDGKSSIGTSFTEKFYVQPQEDFVMFRYIPTNITDDNYSANQEGNERVTIKVGAVFDHDTGVFTELTPAEASAAGVLAFKTENGAYKVWISKDQSNNVIQYVYLHNSWEVATQDQIDNPALEKWGMIRYQLNESYNDADGYFSGARSQAIRVIGTYNGKEMTRNVIIKTSPRQELFVTCQKKYVAERAGERQIVSIRIPSGLSRSVFPLEFTIEPDGYSLTPVGDVLPVSYGTSTIDGKNEPAFYFVKTLTQAAYDNLSTVDKDWKVFDCTFKTTVARNQCRVYVKNRFFKDDNASDEFYNYAQRLFTWGTVPSSVYRHGNTEFSFVLDAAHSGNTCVWWDPRNILRQSDSVEQAVQKGLSTSNRVLPPIITITMNGFTPQYMEDGETPVTPGLSHYDANKYHYNVGSGEPLSDMASVTIKLRATGAIGGTGSITLSTENITENPELYASLTSSNVSILGASFTNVGFTSSTVNCGLDKTTQFHFTYVDGMVVPITVTMNGLTLNGNTGTNALFTPNSDGTYTFTPTDTSVRTYTFDVKTTSRFTPVSVKLSHEDYTESTTSLNRAATFVIPTNAIYIRNATNGNPSIGNNTYVYLNNSTSTTNAVYHQYTNYYNRANVTVTLSRFTIVDDDAPVYFWYTYNNTTYSATTTLSALVDATNGSPVTLHFRGQKTVTFNYSNYSTTNLSYTSSGITLAFSSISYKAYYLDFNPGSTYEMSVSSSSSSVTIERIVITYYSSSYVPDTVTVSTGSYSISNATGTWTGSTDNVSIYITPTSSTETSITQVQVTYLE